MSQIPPPPPPTQPMQISSQPPSAGPSRNWYWLPAILFLLIVGPAIYSFVVGLDGITDGLLRVRAPGSTEVTLEKGTWTVFYEWQGEFEGVDFITSSEFPGMEASATAPDGTEIPVRGLSGSYDYSIGGRTGFGVGELDVPVSGDYVFNAELLDSDDDGQYVLGLGKDVGRSTVLLVVGIFGMIGGALLTFLAWLIVIIMRSRGKKRMQAAGYPV